MDRAWVFLRFIVGTVLIGIAVNLASDYLGDRYPSGRTVLLYLAVTGILTWLIILLTQAVRSYVVNGRYAVEALVLNSRDELLLYRHPHHRVMLPPGGRVKRSEFPNTALQKRLQERVELNPRQYAFDRRVHDESRENRGHLGEIQRVAAPFLVQRELHRQRAFVRFHYDFIYVLRLLDDAVVAAEDSRYGPVCFVDLPALEEMVAQRRTFPDVLDAYRLVLAEIARGAR